MNVRNRKSLHVRLLLALSLMTAPVTADEINGRAQTVPAESTVINGSKNGINEKNKKKNKGRQQEQGDRDVVLNTARRASSSWEFQPICWQDLRYVHEASSSPFSIGGGRPGVRDFSDIFRCDSHLSGDCHMMRLAGVG